MAKQASPKPKLKLGVLFWIAFILLISLVFIISSPGIIENLQEVGIGVSDEQEPQFGDDGTVSIVDGPEEEAPPVVPVDDPAPSNEDPPSVETDDAEPEEIPQTDSTQEVEDPEPEPAVVETRDATLYFYSNGSDGSLVLSPVTVPLSPTRSPLKENLMFLLSGTAPDGYRSFVGNEVSLNRVWVSEGTAYIDVSEDLSFHRLGSEGIKARLRQMVATARSFSTVDQVQFLIDGQIQAYLSEGVFAGSPLTEDRI